MALPRHIAIVLAGNGRRVYAPALIVAGRAGELAEGVALAAQAIDSGRARASLDRLVAITTGKG